ncbi:hypothetical protein Q8A67_012547 [Cirrhinus molitorella]|uniref:Uncharacterized protein n=1 Tax=Cirrhinus molitorella TaxID=172907 RepID=A0AA88PN24_9TELE|nr:hypothetical protein Q8A67_012547 [Cirrhinus molitorella]
MDPRAQIPPDQLAELAETLCESLLPTATISSPPASPMACLATYSREVATCSRSLLQSALYFEGKLLGEGLVLHIGCFHVERMSFLVLEEASVNIVLGRPWLTKHNPITNWRTGEITKWNPKCHLRCQKNLPKPPVRVTHLPICFTSVESPNTTQALSIPPEYQAFQGGHASPNSPTVGEGDHEGSQIYQK